MKAIHKIYKLLLESVQPRDGTLTLAGGGIYTHIGNVTSQISNNLVMNLTLCNIKTQNKINWGAPQAGNVRGR